ncbi:MAG: D-2-hydroxyacid dehydrogenase, partial [Gammaproteobacteria bacterium]|nr:D-2-hydroxyacid dehydrogenase [Gammaproteobacteria bacterium]
MQTPRCRIVVAGVPRSYQEPLANGRWLTDRHVAAIEGVSEAVELIHTSRAALEAGKVPEPGADVLLIETCGRKRYRDELPMAAFAALVTPRLRWLQSCSSGVGHILDLDLLPDEVVITNAAGVHAAALAESVLAAILFSAKQLARRLENQRARRWEELRCFELRNKTVCIIGTGRIGTATARRAGVFGLKTIGVRRRAEPAEKFDRVFDRHHLIDALATADFVVMACPLTAETEGMIG